MHPRTTNSPSRTGSDADGLGSVTSPTEDHPSGESSARGAVRPGLVTLRVQTLPGAAPVWRVSGAMSVGRSRQSAIRLGDERVSRLHARVEPRANGLWIVDEGSRHGCAVNGMPVGAAGALAEYGSIVRFGDTLMLSVDDVE